MRRAASFIAILVLVCQHPMGLQASQTPCVTCRPSVNPAIQLSGNYHVCFETNATFDLYAAGLTSEFSAGVEEYWGHYFEDSDIGISFSWEVGYPSDCDSYDILVKAVPNSAMHNNLAGAEAHPTSTGHGAEIWINAHYLPPSTNENVYWLGGHEMGHVLGFGDIYNSACAGLSIMYGDYVNREITCSDSLVVSERYNSSTPEEDEAWIFIGGFEECYDVYRKFVHYVFDGQSWQYAGYSWGGYLRTECGPPPI